MFHGTRLTRIARSVRLSSIKVLSRTFGLTRTILPKHQFSSASASTPFIAKARALLTFQQCKISNNYPLGRFFHRSAKSLGDNITRTKSEPSGFGARLKKLSREYGWSAFGVYLALSALDFPLCYLLVRYLGAEKLGKWEHSIISTTKNFVPDSIQEIYYAWRNRDKQIKVDGTGESNVDGHVKANALDVEEAEENKKKDASLATQLALAYAIHKSFIFIRVPITAAITPRIVKMLRNWGWDIGRRTTKEAKELRRAALKIKNCQTKSNDR